MESGFSSYYERWSVEPRLRLGSGMGCNNPNDRSSQMTFNIRLELSSCISMQLVCNWDDHDDEITIDCITNSNPHGIWHDCPLFATETVMHHIPYIVLGHDG